MKTLNKINILVACLAILVFTACKDEILREPSPAANPNNTNVFFRVSNVTAPVLSITQKSFKVIIGRTKIEEDQVVALSAETVYDSIFTVPQTVTFKAGQDSVAIEVTVDKMQLMKKYHLAIIIDQEQTDPYKAQKVYPKLELNVLKEDFSPYANGTYTSAFFEDNWAQTLEYSPSTKIYRFKDCWMPGYNVTFKWDEAVKPGEVNMIGTATSAKDFIIIPTGYVDTKYGMVSAYYPQANKIYYSSATSTFTFKIKWVVSAGSFGVYNDTYLITQKL